MTLAMQSQQFVSIETYSVEQRLPLLRRLSKPERQNEQWHLIVKSLLKGVRVSKILRVWEATQQKTQLIGTVTHEHNLLKSVHLANL